MQEKKMLQKLLCVCEREREREREGEGETTFLWRKTIQRMEERITNL